MCILCKGLYVRDAWSNLDLGHLLLTCPIINCSHDHHLNLGTRLRIFPGVRLDFRVYKQQFCLVSSVYNMRLTHW
jgi:hypothetical protein